MAVIEDFVGELRSIPALAGIGTQPVINNSKQLPTIVYNSRGLVRESYVQGSFGLRNTLFQIDVYSEDYTQLNSLREAIIDRFHGFIGVFNEAAGGTTIVSSCKVVTAREDLNDSNDNTYRASIELNIFSS